MSAQTQCPGCAKSFAAGQEIWGKNVACPSCGQRFQVPTFQQAGGGADDPLGDILSDLPASAPSSQPASLSAANPAFQSGGQLGFQQQPQAGAGRSNSNKKLVIIIASAVAGVALMVVSIFLVIALSSGDGESQATADDQSQDKKTSGTVAANDSPKSKTGDDSTLPPTPPVDPTDQNPVPVNQGPDPTEQGLNEHDATAAPVGSFEGLGSVMHLTVSMDGKFLAGADRKGTPANKYRVFIWDVASRQQLHNFDLPHSIRDLHFSPSGKYLVAAENGPHYHVWNPTTGELINSFKMTKHELQLDGGGSKDFYLEVEPFAFFGNDDRILTAGKGIVEIQIPDGEVLSVHDRDERYARSGSNPDHWTKTKLEPHILDVGDIKGSPNGQSVIWTGSVKANNGLSLAGISHLRRWGTDSDVAFKPSEKLRGSIAFSGDGKYVAGGNDMTNGGEAIRLAGA